MASLKDFMISRVRVKLLKMFFSNPKEMYYVRQLTRETEEEINAVRRELKRLEKQSVLHSEARGNRLYYYCNPQYDFYHDLINLVAKTTGLGGAIRSNKAKLGQVKFVMFSGKFLHQLKRDQNEVDILVVGDIVLPELASLIRKEEAQRGNEINYTVMNRDEFQFRKERRDPFLLSILSQSRIMIIGSEEDLVN
jgi:hypothetical protein